MSKKSGISRRQFVASAISTAATSALVSKSSFGSTLAEFSASVAIAPNWKDQGIELLAKSPHAKLRNIPVHAVTIDTGFWGERRSVNVQKSIPSMGQELEEHGRMDNFRRLAGKSNAPQRGPQYSDSDVYKWMEAVGFALQSGDIPQLRERADRWIDEVIAVQLPDGYLNTFYAGERAAERMTPKAQPGGHELYNIGHMIQGAIAYYRGTGDRRLLDAGIRFLDDFLMPSFGPAPKKPIVSGHPEIEMALIEMYRLTGDKRQLDLAGYILGGDDRLPLKREQTIYLFSGTPFTGRTKLEGHAVRAMYACCGATDYYLETGDPTYWKTLNALWDDMTSTKMYVTGGVGSRSDGEAFGDAYELPNATAYGESCAAIGNFMWNWRMLAATGDAKFADVMERALYNGINSGMSLDGTTYCYRNPLAFDPAFGETIRNPWYDTTCCPPNLERTFAALPGYFYSTSGDGLYVHFYNNSELNWRLENGVPLKVTQKTNYPWDGDVSLTVSPEKPVAFTLYLRVPGWVDAAKVNVNGQAFANAKPGAYLPIHREWKPGDVVRASFPMNVQALASNPRIVENEGRVALQRGPLVYCMEGLDQPSGVDLADAAINPKAQASNFQAELDRNLLDGVVVLRTEGAVLERAAAQPLYSPYQGASTKARRTELRFIPYYAWANRKPTTMQVWVPVLTSAG